MRLAFMGTPEFAVPALDALQDAGHDIAAVYCQPPRPAGRGKGVRPSPVQARAESLGLAVRTPARLRGTDGQAAFAALELDAAVIAAYGLILPAPILQAPRLGCFNIHASLLPRWRGAAPIQRAILAGDAITGVTIMAMDEGLDTGATLLREETPVDAKTAGELTVELAAIGARLMAEHLADPFSRPAVPQPGDGATYAPKVLKEEARLAFGLPADAVERQVRAFNPAPGAWFEHAGERVRVLRAEIMDGAGAPGLVLDDRLLIACAAKAIRPTLVQRAGRGAMSADELLRGFPIEAGVHLV